MTVVLIHFFIDLIVVVDHHPPTALFQNLIRKFIFCLIDKAV